MIKNYLWKDNPTEANVALYDTDILNECLMHLKYSAPRLTPFCINSASYNTSGVANLLNYSGNVVKFNCGNSLVPEMTSNSQSPWSLEASHSILSSGDIFRSFNLTSADYCTLQHTSTIESPSFISIQKTTDFSFDYLYIKFNTTFNPGDIKTFHIENENGTIFYAYDNLGDLVEKNEFLIPITNFYNKKIKIVATSNVNDVAYTNFPCVIKLLDKSQVISLTEAFGFNAVLSEISDLTIPVTANATFNIFLDTDGNKEIFSTPFAKSDILPSSPVSDQIHFHTNTQPCTPKKYNGTRWEIYNKIPVGYVKTNSSGVISEVGTFPYNQNSYDLNMLSFTQNLSANGYATYPNGVILQWGSFTNATGSGTVTFPLAFPNNCFTVLAIDSIYSSGNGHMGITSKTKTSFTWGSTGDSKTINWFALGN